MPSDVEECKDVTLSIKNYFKEKPNEPLIFERYYGDNKRIPQIQRRRSMRILQKTGAINTFITHLPNKQLRYLKDLGNTLISMRWRWILGCVFVANMFTYIFFGLAWMAAAIHSGDFEKNSTDTLCIVGTKTFSGYLILSIETITTIGTGFIYPTDCHEGWIIITLQAMVGVVIEGVLIIAVYAKMSRPIYKDNVNLFSKKAIINIRDGYLCLIFRIRDNFGKYRMKTSIKAYFVDRRSRLTTTGGEDLYNYIVPLKIDDYGLLIWPLEIVHRITKDSPLWDISAENLLTKRFEIFAVIEGDSLSTGQTSQSRTSYLNTEILWGYRFVSCVNFNEKCYKYYVDDEKFNVTTPISIPLCSARNLYKILYDKYHRKDKICNNNSNNNIECRISIGE